MILSLTKAVDVMGVATIPSHANCPVRKIKQTLICLGNSLFSVWHQWMGNRIGVLCLFLGCLLPPFLPLSSHAFDYFEHKAVSDLAFEHARRSKIHQESFSNIEIDKALKSLGLNQECDPGSLAESFSPEEDFEKHVIIKVCAFLQDTPITFGDLAGLAGDHFEPPNQYDDRKGLLEFGDEILKNVETFTNPFSNEFPRVLATRRHWRQACQWYKETNEPLRKTRMGFRDCFRSSDFIRDWKHFGFYGKGDERDDVPPVPTTGYIPSRAELGEFEKLPNYRGLAQDNKKHFPRRSWQEFLSLHQLALEKAQAYAESSPKNLNLLKEALVWEGFAQHFLHDSFSSGHIASEYGECQSTILLPIACDPNKALLQHTHDVLNGIGLFVEVLSVNGTAETFAKWYAFGDRALFIPEANRHRQIIVFWSSHSIQQVLHEVVRGKGFIIQSPKNEKRINAYCHSNNKEFNKVCVQWIGIFPVPSSKIYKETAPVLVEQVLEKQRGTAPKEFPDLVKFEPAPRNPSCMLGLSCKRSPDFRVPDISLEGWKVSVTWGTVWGDLDELSPNGTVSEARDFNDGGSFEIGYVRETDIPLPYPLLNWNYTGFGVFLIPGTRTSIYPLSIGSWFSPPSRKWSFGYRINTGVRIVEANQQENRSNQIRTRFEISLPIDFVYSIYPPIGVYARAETLTFVFPNLHSKFNIDSLFVGRGSLTFGISYDLAGIL